MDPFHFGTPTPPSDPEGNDGQPHMERDASESAVLQGKPKDSFCQNGTVQNGTIKNGTIQNGAVSHSVTVDMPANENDAALWSGGEVRISAHSTPSLSKVSNGFLQDTSSLSRFYPTQSNQESKKRVVVLGSGDFGLALTGRLVQANYQVVVASRNPQKARQRVLDVGATVMQQEEALQQGNVVVMAVPFTHVETLPVQHLAGKIVIDVSNRTPQTAKSLGSISQAEQLQAIVPGARVVKAFNVLSAYALTRGNMGSKEVPVCSDDEAARRLVCGMARDLRFTPLDLGRLANAREVEAIPLSFFPEWRGAFITSLVIWIAAFLLLVFEWQVCENLTRPTQDWSSLASLPTGNVSIACADTSLTLLALCYLPGVMAAYLQLFRGTKYSQFPGWLDKWLKSRKQLGILMLLHALLHALLKLSGNPLSWNAGWQTNTCIGCGCFALFIAGILGLTSLPSVAGNMTWREFAFVQSVLGWFTLLLSTLHLIFADWDNLIKANFTCYLPSSGQFVMVLPLLTIAFKLPLLLPCVDSILVNIRQGYNRTPCCSSRDHSNTDN